MATINFNIDGPGTVHVYRSTDAGTTWQDLGKISANTNSVNFNIGDKFRFVAEPEIWAIFTKFCAADKTTCVSTSTFEGTIVTESGTLYSYFAYNTMMIVVAIVITAIILLMIKKR